MKIPELIPVKAPDLNAPRFRPKIKNILTTDLLEAFKDKFPKYKDKSNKELHKIIEDFSIAIWQTVISERGGVSLPESLGTIFIGTCTSKKKFNIDFPLSIRLKVKVRNRNFESDSFLAKIFYTTWLRDGKYKVENHQLWAFQGHRNFKRTVAKEYPKVWKKYLVIDDYKKASKTYMNHIKRDNILNMSAIIPEGYNEFNMD